ncbi:MAG: hypothetical protein LBR51_00355 [Bacteroidales bacterium]|jgi:hypothetical protein|nr:hypothetical protein [Bacteroidales bacterium]
MKKYVLTAVLLFAVVASVSSQSLTEKRRIKTTALQVYENYKVTLSSLYSKDNYTEDNFMSLFDDNTVLYNDIIPVNTPMRLSPYKYFTRFRENIRRIYPEFNKLSLGEPVSVGGKWQIKCHFSRAARFRTLNEMKYPRWSFDYTMTIEMDKRYDDDKKVYQDALITAIDVDKPLGKFFVIEKPQGSALLAKGKPLTDWDEEYQSRIFPENEWKLSDIEPQNRETIFEFMNNYTWQPDTADNNFYVLKSYANKKEIIFGVGIHGCPMLAFGNQMSEKNKEWFKGIDMTSSALSLSAFYGKQMLHKEKSTLLFKVGLDLNLYFYKYKGSCTDSISKDKDIDGDENLDAISIKIKSLNERITRLMLSLSVGVEYVHQLTTDAKKPIFLSFEFGVVLERRLSLRNKSDYMYDYHGIYTYFGSKVELDHELNYGDGLNGKQVSQKLNSNPFDFGIFGGVGLCFALNNSNLIKFGITYKQTFIAPVEDTETKYVLLNKDGNDKDIYTSLLKSTDKGLSNLYFGFSWIKTIYFKK